MKIKKFLAFVNHAIKDPERDHRERLFLILNIISEISIILGLIGDIIIGENIGEIIIISAVAISVPIISFGSLYLNKLKVAIGIIIASLVLIIIPGLYIFGGGITGGGVIWIIFTYLYVGLVISGKWRNIVLTWLFVMSFGLLGIEYYFPEIIQSHSREIQFADMLISIVLVGSVGFVMTWAQNLLFKDENARARKEAERAEELTRSQNRFFSSMSHEIRTPINSILGLNELILRDQNISDEIAKDAAGIQGSGKMLLALINDILDFSKMEAGSMDIVPVDYRIGNTLSEVVNMIWLKAHDKGLRFDISVDPSVPSVLYGDEVRVKQIIVNLLNNAVKYTHEGGIDLHIESDNLDEKNTVLRISITDTGMGIKKEALPYLFDAFKRVDEEKNRHIEGTGLGLSIVKQLVELMDGTVSVNSVYGEGSTFTVTLKQGISDITEVGDLNIHNQHTVKRDKYESSFTAPDARILIVDDNEMNLEVEKKLLLGTGMTIDTVTSGKEALDMTLKFRYDVILMDHLMPEMDGIDCFKNIKAQSGGMNRTTPVIVLTANAGSDNRELYSASGFDGYLVKPVSGDALEEILIKNITKEKLNIRGKIMQMREDINTASGYSRKSQVIITSTSMCDLPESVIKKLGIPILPFNVYTEHGVFKDGVQMDTNELIRHISSGADASSMPPEVKDYTEFFARVLKKTHHLIHISITTSMSRDYENALEAAKSFDNVTVINSEVLSSATGILVLIGCKLVQQNIPADEIVKELELVKKRLRCSFVIDSTEYLAKRQYISSHINTIAKSLNLHLSLCTKDDLSHIGGIWAGDIKRAYRKYIQKSFPVDIIPDSEVVFITYADVPNDTLEWIKEEISKYSYFEHYVFRQASAAISSNCGPGTFGILYFVKSNKTYNIGSFIEDEEDDEYVDVNTEITEEKELPVISQEEPVILPWYKTLDCIDGDVAIANSGSEDSLKVVLKIFHDSIDQKSDELNEFYDSKDWNNYTIKIHALKSSAKLIGALELSEKAQKLETAGKEGNADYITANHNNFMAEYNKFRELLKDYGDTAGSSDDSEKLLADEDLVFSVYEELKSAAELMDSDTIDEIFKELSQYRFSDDDSKMLDDIKDKASKYDYDGIVALLSE